VCQREYLESKVKQEDTERHISSNHRIWMNVMLRHRRTNVHLLARTPKIDEFSQKFFIHLSFKQ
jgi:hypothetical protein